MELNLLMMVDSSEYENNDDGERTAKKRNYINPTSKITGKKLNIGQMDT